jgi:hypothetical protein
MNTIKFSELKALRDIVGDEWRDVATELSGFALDDVNGNGCSDWRLIAAPAIDQIMQDELSGDEYVLGCFNAWFLADILGIDTDTVQRMQDADGYEAIGQLIIGTGKLAELQASYVDHDGYGHHFSHYDGSEEEITLGGHDYYVFRVN